MSKANRGESFELTSICRSVSSEVSSPNEPLVVALLQSLPQLPAVPRLQHTAALTLGNFSLWMASALDSGQLADIMPQLLQMLTAGKLLPLKRQQDILSFADFLHHIGMHSLPSPFCFCLTAGQHMHIRSLTIPSLRRFALFALQRY